MSSDYFTLHATNNESVWVDTNGNYYYCKNGHKEIMNILFKGDNSILDKISSDSYENFVEKIIEKFKYLRISIYEDDVGVCYNTINNLQKSSLMLNLPYKSRYVMDKHQTGFADKIDLFYNRTDLYDFLEELVNV